MLRGFAAPPAESRFEYLYVELPRIPIGTRSMPSSSYHSREFPRPSRRITLILMLHTDRASSRFLVPVEEGSSVSTIVFAS
jgi:hypothetical protein